MNEALASPANHPRRTVTLLPLIGALYFMVSGGPYGLEELAQKTGFALAIALVLATPIVWALPTALMVGELAAALPEEGGYYAWVRRALGPFWGFQEAWLSLAASVFDMALYPTLFVLYLRRLVPALADDGAAFAVSAAVIAVCAGWNMLGAKSVGRSSALMTIALLAPFVLLAILAFARAPAAAAAAGASAPEAPSGDIAGGVMIAMWNLMGWDNASTIAGEVHRPQRTYPIGVLAAVTLVALTYVFPLGAMAHARVDPSAWETGSWVDAAGDVGGRALGVAVVIGGMVSALGMFNALCLSYSRLPVVLAEDGYLPPIFARRLPSNDAPWVAILACSLLWMASLGLSFERLVLLDVLLYGLSLILEFVALIVLRIKEPSLERPFRVPGGLAGAIAIALGPTALIGLALVRNAGEKMGSVSGLALGLAIVAAGPLVYGGILAIKRAAGRRAG